MEARKIYYYEMKSCLYNCYGSYTDMEKWEVKRVSYSENRDEMVDNPFHLDANALGTASLLSGRCKIVLEETPMKWGCSYVHILFLDGEEVARQSAGHFDSESKSVYSRNVDSDGDVSVEECSRNYTNPFNWGKLPVELLLKLRQK